MKILKGLLSLLLAALMIPIMIVPLSAELATYGSQDFESLNAETKPTTGHGFGGLPPHCTVKSESENKYLRIPFVGGENSGNWDTALTAKHLPLNNGESFTFEVSYRPHFNGNTDASTPTVEAQFQNYAFTNPNGNREGGIYMNLYVINLATGTLSGCGDVVEGAKGLVLDEWNTVKLVFYPNNCSFKIYVNDALYSVQSSLTCVASGFSSHYLGGCTDATIGSNQLILAKCNKNKGAYVSESNADGASYIDVDNIRVYETEKVNYTMNGEARTIGKGTILDLTSGGKQLLWATIEDASGTSYKTDDPIVSVEEGMKIDAAVMGIKSVKAEARVCAPLGIRFQTEVNLDDLAALQARENVANVELGTLVVPTLAIAGIGKATLETVSKVAHVMLPAGEWYSKDETAGTAIYAGSIANIQAQNYNREFTGVGYMKITFTDGTETVIYAADGIDTKNTTSLTSAARKKLMSGGVKGTAKKLLREFEAQYEGDVMKLYGEDLKGLNVLALGDSLFSGTIGYPQSTQWVNKIGLDCNWNLTNLGIGSMTVSLTERNNVPNRGNKNSMYDWMFNNKNDFRWGSRANGVSPNPFFSCGNISGKGEDVDLIILEGGCNDYGTAIAAPLGTMDSHDPATFLGAWNCITERLMADYPNATIVFLTTWRLGPQTRDWDTLTSIEYSESVIDLYNEKYADNPRIALINAGNPSVSGVNMLDSTWRNTYSTDSYHLKDTGMAIMAEHMLPLLWQIMKNTGKID